MKPTHTFSTPGRYSISLIVTDNLGASNEDKTIAEITVPNRVPSAPLVDGPEEGTQNFEYSFTAMSTDEDNDTIRYHFDWDDGTTNITEFLPNGTETMQMHIWIAADIYTISVQAYDNNTLSSATNHVILIDAHIIEDIGYITDDDVDGTYGTFHGEKINTDLGLDGGKYLIDINGDGNWNYTYDMVEGLAVYDKELEFEIPWIYVIGLLGLILIIAITVIFYKKK